MIGLDETDCHILNLLQDDCRRSLTDISKGVGLSVDSVKKRIAKMQANGVFFPRIQLRPRHFGYPYIVDVKIKLRDYDSARIKRFIEYLVAHPRVAEVMSVSGEWDFTIVILSKHHEDLARVSDEIRSNFAGMISDWIESLSTVVYKFERYDMLGLREYDSG